ncbi:sigma-54 dependent transcriptional regulator [uncultured Pseudoteredinibacter sp.]|uniref:sigma-54-dependent transcriptional regulator n=1 Tax=uncultured Pseudoteredinibacter sp. TaxID=1641701 RepID=UPI0026369D42|nr:sigma-54 dependent transcriptional regulator [uncultured Pseudoteredinibacter sp.]
MILIVDDNPAIGEALSLLLELNDYKVRFVECPDTALEMLSQESIQLVIQDMNFKADTTSGGEGQQLFYDIRAQQPDLPIILMTAWANLSMAVELVKAGAADYISKPWDDSKLLITIRNLLEMSELREENTQLHAQQDSELSVKGEVDDQLSTANLCGAIVESPLMRRLMDMAIQVAPTDVPVLITGPNGSGKEKIAEVVQANSRRSDKPFVKVNVGALSADLIEAELFGAEKGAYTGADKVRIGRFETADGGTLFLDEMGNLSLEGQQKLLRVLQSGEYERVGSSQTRKVDVRVITATNEDLPAAIKRGDFREDLYYRLNVIELKSPPLSERPEDIIPLLNHFISLAGAVDRSIAQTAKQALKQYAWPGNVRELSNKVQRALLLQQSSELQLEDFDLQADGNLSVSAVDLSIEDIQRALDEHGGVVSRAARHLGISRQALYRRLSKSESS